MKKYELTTIQDTTLIIDVTSLLSEEVLFINISTIAKKFNKPRQRVHEFINSNGFRQYVMAYCNVTKKCDNELIIKRLGNKGGIYLHSDIVIYFLRWLSPEFAAKCDLFIKERIQKSHDKKVKDSAFIIANKANSEWLNSRKKGINSRKQLQKKIEEFCKYAMKQRGGKYSKFCPYYKEITNSVYSYLKLELPTKGVSLRDKYDGKIIEKIEIVELKVIEALDEIMLRKSSRHNIKSQIYLWLDNHAVGYSI